MISFSRALLILSLLVHSTCTTEAPPYRPISCVDGTKNGGEVDVDCSGLCVPCAEGRACLVDKDCISGVCQAGTCRAAACADGIRNGSEIDIDCGGPCPACGEGKVCGTAAHCASAVCVASRCQAPSCTDRVKNGRETDADCGGACPSCGVGKACAAAADCGSRVCQGGACRSPTCADGIKNGDEADQDCGGASCGRCATGKGCVAPADCASGNCAGGTCGTPNIAQVGESRRFSDGSLAIACYGYKNPPADKLYAGRTGDGRYTIDTDGDGAQAPFDVYCDMTTSDGGWTLVDNDPSPTNAFTTREPGANPDINVTRGSYLPAYPWSQQPQMLCKSSVYTGAVGWVTLNALGPLALEYPTQTTPNDATYSDQWSYNILNGNTQQGITAWLYKGSGRFGSVWIGNGGQPTCACDYYAPSPETGLGTYASGNGPTCSTWVR